MSCLDMQEAPGRQAVGSVQAGRPEAGQAVCVQQPGESPLQRLETLSARQQEEQKAIMEVSLQKTGKTLPFFLSYEEEKQGGDKAGSSFTCRLHESCFCVILKKMDGIVRL